MITQASRYRAPRAWLREVLGSFRARRPSEPGNVIELRIGVLDTPIATVTVALTAPMSAPGAEEDLQDLSRAIVQAISRARR